ncbi:hypothetical protein T492DRAFT_1054731 [Pavlovales sp. CCMP2436]|nr:hypothetical protein T492DRAFT_1054731 [Pavlovales sp. CCMP2436]|mmetsp:Transcript_26530/g.65504  ORF Transcript_26530/g.65504 Transcript_26530/m.65504 type:complete len:357 (+) Transcript_26530:2-1072(+)
MPPVLTRTMKTFWLCALALAALAPASGAVVFSRGVGHALARARPSSAHVTMEASASPTRSGKVASVKPKAVKPSPIWELDLYTRPVTNDQGKKLWELLVTDANGVMRHVEPLPSSLINSRELRKRIQALVDRAEVRPTQVRFFRTEMQAMIGVALSELPVLTVPTRRTYELRNWLENRYRDVYPTMPGYKPELADAERARPALDRQPVKMPDALRGDKWAFVELPLGELRGPDASIDASNIGFGNTFSVEDIDLPDSALVPGLLITSTRAEPLAAWMSGTELASVTADLERGDLSLEVGIDTLYMFARLWDLTQREEAASFMRTCREARGLHFIAVRESLEEEGVKGFWLLRNYDA